MEAKLIKTEVNYLLKNEEGVIIASTSLINLGLALSIKNCEAIVNGYDLDELASDIDSEKVRWSTEESLEHFGYMIGIKDGFQQALEILGDKKFSEEDMMNIYILGGKYKVQQPHSFLEKGNEIIQSLQQTEWGVEIEMEINLNGKNGLDRAKMIPKLDADGCLILKRK